MYNKQQIIEAYKAGRIIDCNNELVGLIKMSIYKMIKRHNITTDTYNQHKEELESEGWLSCVKIFKNHKVSEDKLMSHLTLGVQHSALKYLKNKAFKHNVVIAVDKSIDMEDERNANLIMDVKNVIDSFDGLERSIVMAYTYETQNKEEIIRKYGIPQTKIYDTLKKLKKKLEFLK